MAKVKKRAEKYEKPLHISGTFEDVIKVAIGKEKDPERMLEEPKKEPKKKGAKKK